MALLVSDKVPSGSRITGTGAGQKMGWLGHSTGVSCTVMRVLLDKRPFLEVRPEAVVGDSNSVDVVAIVVQIDEVRIRAKTLSEVMGDLWPLDILGGGSPSEMLGEFSPS